MHASELKSALRKRPRAVLLSVIGALVLVWLWSGRDGMHNVAGSPVTVVRRGPLDITVMEGGSTRARDSQEIKCEVRVGYQGTKILKLVEEGYQVTEEDIRTNRVLVELDSSEIQKTVAQQEIAYQGAAAALTEARQDYEIALGTTQSDVLAAGQKERFARMDFEKFLGDRAAAEVVEELKLEEVFAIVATNASAVKIPSPESVNLERYSKVDALGDGEAKQKLRKLEEDLQVARKELGQATATRDGTRRLFEKGFVTKVDLERDEIAFDNNRVKVQSAETARDLYLKYEFVKSAEESLSKYIDASRELVRARKLAISKLAQADAKRKSAEGQFEVQASQRNELQLQRTKCTITASKPGLVVYGGNNEDMYYYGGEERIREGAQVRERQSIITIPDLSRMSVRVKIHESYIKKIAKGMKARITVDAYPNIVLSGEVISVGVLPDSQNRWMNPDLKVYLTTISIDGSQDWLKPGMTAKVEIMINRLSDVVHVPVQCVVTENGEQVCYMARNGSAGRRVVTTGEFNDEFIVVKTGLQEGDSILLRPPSSAATTEKKTGKTPPANEVKPATKDAKPVAAKK